MTWDAIWSFTSAVESTRYSVRALGTAIHARYAAKCRAAHQDAGKFYVFEHQDHTDDWRTNIRNALAAPILIVVVDDSYFASAYCFFEWLAYTHLWGAKRRQIGKGDEKIGVFLTLNLSSRAPRDFGISDAESVLGLVRERFGADKSLAADRELWRSIFNADYAWDTETGVAQICAALERWAASLGEKQILQVGDGSLFPDSEAGAGVVDSIYVSRVAYAKFSQALEKFIPGREKQLQRAAQLALFCLAFDRFHDGGWGFSLEEDYLVDDDRHVLSTGADEVNLLAIRALRDLLDVDSYVDELEELTARLASETRANLGVTDRKQRLTGCLVHLISGADGVIAGRALPIVREATSQDARRWIVEEPRIADDASVLHYAFCQKTLAALDRATVRSIVKDILKELKAHVATHSALKEHLIGGHNERLAKVVRCFVPDSMITRVFGCFVRSAQSKQAPTRKNVQKALQLSLLLSDREFVLRCRGEYASDVRKLHSDAQHLPSSELALLCLMLSDFLYHASKDTAGEYGGEALNDDLAKVREKFGDLWAVLQERLTGPAMLSNIAGMNSVGWAAMLLLCEKQGVPVHSTRDAVAIWRSGLSLRREIGGVIRTEFTSADSLRDSLVQLVTRQLEQQGITAQEWPGFAHALLARGILRTQPDVPRIPRSSPAAPYAAHVGTLEVEKIAPKNDPSRAPKSLMRVRSADAGYSKLFLLPFAERTGLRADSLSRMLRHFGGSDDDLVGNIAKVVVNKCYLVQKDALEPVSFEARTKDIVASLTATDGAAEQDILELHGQYNGETVYVRRNVTLFEEEGVDQDSPKRVFYRWTFSDMTAEWSLADYPKYVRPVPTQKAS